MKILAKDLETRSLTGELSSLLNFILMDKKAYPKFLKELEEIDIKDLKKLRENMSLVSMKMIKRTKRK